MERLAELQGRIANLGELQDIMGAMRALAALRLQQAQTALPGIRRYTEVVDDGLVQAIGLLGAGGGGGGRGRGRPQADGPAAVIAFTSEHGFAGAYNEHVLDRVAPLLAGDGHQLLVVGSRGRLKADERSWKVSWWRPMATHLDGVIEVARRLAEQLYHVMAHSRLERVLLVHGRNTGGAGWKVGSETLLPFDSEGKRRRDMVAPLIQLDPADLFNKLVEEYVFTRLMHAAMESFASENGARLAAMEAAHDNIEIKLDALTLQARQQRQEEITTELLDVVTGAMAATE
ncbi:ATPase [uncultured Gammaproteobacteria bacterium]